MSVKTLEISRKAALYGQFLVLAFLRRVESTNTASKVLLFLLKPNCSCPRKPLASTTSVMCLHILTVRIRRIFDGIVIGRYIEGCSESPP